MRYTVLMWRGVAFVLSWPQKCRNTVHAMKRPWGATFTTRDRKWNRASHDLRSHPLGGGGGRCTQLLSVTCHIGGRTAEGSVLTLQRLKRQREFSAAVSSCTCQFYCREASWEPSPASSSPFPCQMWPPPLTCHLGLEYWAHLRPMPKAIIVAPMLYDDSNNYNNKNKNILYRWICWTRQPWVNYGLSRNNCSCNCCIFILCRVFIVCIFLCTVFRLIVVLCVLFVCCVLL
jgi:hypothetical protein